MSPKRKPKVGTQLRLGGVSDKVEPKPKWGGKRANAGRKLAPGKRRSTPHRTRPRHVERHPVHVTLRARGGLPSLRSQRINAELLGILARQGKRRYGRAFQVVEADRWHGRELVTPREARHGTRLLGEGLTDPFSSAWSFNGWTRPVSPLLTMKPWTHPPPRTWLLERGWRIHGLLDPHEARRHGR